LSAYPSRARTDAGYLGKRLCGEIVEASPTCALTVRARDHGGQSRYRSRDGRKPLRDARGQQNEQRRLQDDLVAEGYKFIPLDRPMGRIRFQRLEVLLRQTQARPATWKLPVRDGAREEPPELVRWQGMLSTGSERGRGQRISRRAHLPGRKLCKFARVLSRDGGGASVAWKLTYLNGSAILPARVASSWTPSLATSPHTTT